MIAHLDSSWWRQRERVSGSPGARLEGTSRETAGRSAATEPASVVTSTAGRKATVPGAKGATRTSMRWCSSVSTTTAPCERTRMTRTSPHDCAAGSSSTTASRGVSSTTVRTTGSPMAADERERYASGSLPRRQGRGAPAPRRGRRATRGVSCDGPRPAPEEGEERPHVVFAGDDGDLVDAELPEEPLPLGIDGAYAGSVASRTAASSLSTS